MKFLGIDLGWRSQPSGLCCLEWRSGQLELLNLDRQESIPDVLQWIDTWISPEEPAIIGVDAPTIIPNATGTRLPDKLTHKYFGRYHAGCYPANLGLPFAERTVSFGLALETRGFEHAPQINPQQLGRYQIEVFPHPAIVSLFGLERILKYKKGKLAERRLELIKLYQYIFEVLPKLEPSLNLTALTTRISDYPSLLAFIEAANLDKFPSKTIELKALEDQLDAIICAYISAHWWYWGLARNLVLGNRYTGYIVIPGNVNLAGNRLE